MSRPPSAWPTKTSPPPTPRSSSSARPPSKPEQRRQDERDQAAKLNDATLAEIGKQFDEAQKALDAETDAKLAGTRQALARPANNWTTPWPPPRPSAKPLIKAVGRQPARPPTRWLAWRIDWRGWAS
jgi:hypothetical protein